MMVFWLLVVSISLLPNCHVIVGNNKYLFLNFESLAFFFSYQVDTSLRAHSEAVQTLRMA